MDEKIQYRLDERTTDLQDNVENCQTRVSQIIKYQEVVQWKNFLWYTCKQFIDWFKILTFETHVLELSPLISDYKDGAATAAAADNLHGDGG